MTDSDRIYGRLPIDHELLPDPETLAASFVSPLPDERAPGGTPISDMSTSALKQHFASLFRQITVVREHGAGEFRELEAVARELIEQRDLFPVRRETVVGDEIARVEFAFTDVEGCDVDASAYDAPAQPA